MSYTSLLNSALEVVTDEWFWIPFCAFLIGSSLSGHKRFQVSQRIYLSRLSLPDVNSTGVKTKKPSHFSSHSEAFSLIWETLFQAMTNLNQQKWYDFTSASTNFESAITKNLIFTSASSDEFILSPTDSEGSDTTLTSQLKNQIRLAFYFKKLKDPAVAMIAAEAIATHFNLPKHPANIKPSDLLAGFKVAAQKAEDFLNTHIYKTTESGTFWRINPRHDKFRHINGFLLTLSTSIKTPAIIPTQAEIEASQVIQYKAQFKNVLNSIPDEIRKYKVRKILKKLPKIARLKNREIYIQTANLKREKQIRIQKILRQLPHIAEKAKLQAEAIEANKHHFEHIAQIRASRKITSLIRHYLAIKTPKAELQQLKHEKERNERRLAERLASEQRRFKALAAAKTEAEARSREASRVQAIIAENLARMRIHSKKGAPATTQTKQLSRLRWAGFTQKQAITPSLPSTESPPSSVDITPPDSPTHAAGAGRDPLSLDAIFKFKHKNTIRKPLPSKVISRLTELYQILLNLRNTDGSLLLNMTDFQLFIGGSSIYNIKSGKNLNAEQDIDLYLLKDIDLSTVYKIQAALQSSSSKPVEVTSDTTHSLPYHQLKVPKTDTKPPLDITFYTRKQDGTLPTIEEISKGNLTYYAADKIQVDLVTDDSSGDLIYQATHLTNASKSKPHDGQLIPETKVESERDLLALMKQVYPILFAPNGNLKNKAIDKDTLALIHKNLLTAQPLTPDGKNCGTASPLAHKIMHNYTNPSYAKQLKVMLYTLKQDILNNCFHPREERTLSDQDARYLYHLSVHLNIISKEDLPHASKSLDAISFTLHTKPRDSYCTLADAH